MTQRMRLLAASLTVGAIGFGASAQEPEGPHGPHGFGGPGGERPGLMRAARALDLTEEQRTSVKQMMDEHREATKALREENRNTHRRMRELMESENPDALALGELMLSGRRVMDQLRQAQGDLEQRFIGLLDAEQKTQYEALKKMQGRLGRGDRPFRGRRGAGPRQ